MICYYCAKMVCCCNPSIYRISVVGKASLAVKYSSFRWFAVVSAIIYW